MKFLSRASVIALGIGTVLIITIVVILSTTRASLFSSPQGAVDVFFAEIENGHASIAYAKTAEVFKKVGTEAQFNELVSTKSHLFLNQRTFTELKTQGNSGNARGTITLKDGTTVPLDIALQKEKGVWKVAGFRTGAEVQ